MMISKYDRDIAVTDYRGVDKTKINIWQMFFDLRLMNVCKGQLYSVLTSRLHVI